jgi:hypothetical protein
MLSHNYNIQAFFYKLFSFKTILPTLICFINYLYFLFIYCIYFFPLFPFFYIFFPHFPFFLKAKWEDVQCCTKGRIKRWRYCDIRNTTTSFLYFFSLSLSLPLSSLYFACSERLNLGGCSSAV